MFTPTNDMVRQRAEREKRYAEQLARDGIIDPSKFRAPVIAISTVRKEVSHCVSAMLMVDDVICIDGIISALLR